MIGRKCSVRANRLDHPCWPLAQHQRTPRMTISWRRCYSWNMTRNMTKDCRQKKSISTSTAKVSIVQCKVHLTIFFCSLTTPIICSHTLPYLWKCTIVSTSSCIIWKVPLCPSLLGGRPSEQWWFLRWRRLPCRTATERSPEVKGCACWHDDQAWCRAVWEEEREEHGKVPSWLPSWRFEWERTGLPSLQCCLQYSQTTLTERRKICKFGGKRLFSNFVLYTRYYFVCTSDQNGFS